MASYRIEAVILSTSLGQVIAEPRRSLLSAHANALLIYANRSVALDSNGAPR
jgi:hypothetical protein